MSYLDDYIDRAGAGGVLMVSAEALEDIQANTLPGNWQGEGSRILYRGAPVELHDEWAWGWMVRKADGSYVEAIR